MRKTKKKWWCGGIAVLFVSLLTVSAVAQVKIDLWYPHGGKLARDRYTELEKAFNATHPDIKLECTYAKGTETDVRKLMTAIAGGVGPDVALIDRFTVASWVPSGALTPLDDYVKKTGIEREDYFSYAWDEANFVGHQWALPTGVDSWELFYWNKDMFKEVGLDPNQPPRYTEELDAINEKFFKYDAAGRVTQTGFIPWIQCGHIVAYGRAWAWGGKFYDYETRKITANHPRNIDYWEWVASWAKKLPVKKIEGMRKTFGKAPATNPFFTGRTAMIVQGSWMKPSLDRYAPDLNYGVATTFYPKEKGRENCTGGGGWCYILVKGSEHPDEAFEVMRWLTATKEAWEIHLKYTRAFPSLKKILNDPDIREKYFNNRIAKVGLELLYSPNHFYRPVIPVGNLYWDELKAATEKIIYFDKTPEEALNDVTAKLQGALEAAFKKLKDKGFLKG